MTTESWVNENQAELRDISRQIWEQPELALTEEYACALLGGVLQEHGFALRRDLGGMPTAFRAVWGSGEPRIAFLGEYDALSGLSQQAQPRQEPVTAGAAGHGCGHNLLGTAALGAALALRQRMEELHIPGTVVYFGCPAEETMTGKVRMAAAGCFDGLDAVLAWHPGPANMVLTQNMLAMNTAKFTFTGRASHAAAAPERGRSALDAVELMNVGCNYLREHVPPDVRLHYSVTDGGGEPNLVHARAQSWYYIRALRRQTVDETFERICRIARGAAMMTDTSVEIRLLSGCWELLMNDALNCLLQECLESVPAPAWTREERAFSQELTGAADRLPEGVRPLSPAAQTVFSSTDVADVSWIAPTAQIAACTAPLGVSFHTWQFCACAGASLGEKGMLYAAKVLAAAGERLMTDAALRAEVAGAFARAKGAAEYRPVLESLVV